MSNQEKVEQIRELGELTIEVIEELVYAFGYSDAMGNAANMLSSLVNTIEDFDNSKEDVEVLTVRLAEATSMLLNDWNASNESIDEIFNQITEKYKEKVSDDDRILYRFGKVFAQKMEELQEQEIELEGFEEAEDNE